MKKFSLIFIISTLLFFITIFSSCKKTPPNPNFNIKGDGVEAPCEVLFENTSTEATSFRWTFGDGEESKEKSPKHIYLNAGTYEVKLYATGKGGTSSKAKSVFVKPPKVEPPEPPQKPEADFTFSLKNATAPCKVLFTSTSTGADSYSWDFADGTVKNDYTSDTISHKYLNGGTYTVILTAKNAAGTNQTQKNVVIPDEPQPDGVVAAFVIPDAPQGGYVAPCTITFVNHSQNADTYKWTFGDGQSSTEEDPSHLFSAGGSYEIKLKATNTATGESKEYKESIVIKNEPFEPPPDPPIANFSVTGDNVYAPATVTFTNLSLNADTYQWTFGDGTAESTEKNPSHYYADHGSFTVTLIAKKGIVSSNPPMSKTIEIKKRPDGLKITMIEVLAFPMEKPGGGVWDPATVGDFQRPDPFVVVLGPGSSTLHTTSTQNNVASPPISWTIVGGLTINPITTDIYTFKLREDDTPLPIEEMGEVEFKFTDYTTGSDPYPSTITKTQGSVKIKLYVEWLY